MKIQTKLLLGILGGMIAVYILSFMFQQSRSMHEIKSFSDKSRSAEEADLWQWVDRLQFAIRSPLLEFMTAGEMDMFDKTITSQRNVVGLQEFSLYDADGKMANSTEKEKKGKVLPAELMRPVRDTMKPFKRLTDTSFEIYEPLIAEKNCLKCHESWKEGQLSGVLALRFSSNVMKSADQNWGTFEGDFQKSNLITSTITAFGLLLGVGAIIVISVRYLVVGPIRRAADMLKDISEGDGDLTKRLSVYSQDEIGELATYFNRFVEKLHGIVVRIAANVSTLASSTSELSSISVQTGQAVRSMSEKTSVVAAAAEESSANTVSVAASTEQTSTNLSSVASATEEMSATVGEIAANSEKARVISGEATAKTQAVSAVMQQLGFAANEIGKVTENITRIAAQTNLLALNATIEAASAGEAGRGFAVVAGEIKELARQTATATENIKEKVADVQSSTESAIDGIEKISGVINDVGSIVVGIAAAIGEQSSVTKSVADNVAQASLGVREANVRIAQTATVSKSMASDIAGINEAVAGVRQGGENVEASTRELSKVADQIKSAVGQFKV